MGWYNEKRQNNGRHNEYIRFVNKFQARCILMFKTKMFPLRCNQNWNKKRITPTCRWCSGNNNTKKDEEDEYHIMGRCEEILLKHGDNIMSIIPNLNDTTL